MSRPGPAAADAIGAGPSPSSATPPWPTDRSVIWVCWRSSATSPSGPASPSRKRGNSPRAGHTGPTCCRLGRHPRGRADAAALARDFSDLLGPLESTTAVDTMRALDIWQRHPSAGAFDALLLAVAMRTGAEAVVSDDAGLAAIPGVPVMTAAEAVDRFVPAGG